MTGIILLSVSGLVYLISLIQYIRLIRSINTPMFYSLPCLLVLVPLAGKQIINLFMYLFSNPVYTYNLLNEIYRLLLAIFFFIGTFIFKPVFRERSDMELKLKQARQNLNDIIDFLPDPTFVIDNDKKVIAWNRSMEKMTGVLKQDILGKSNYTDYFYIEPRPLLIDYALNPAEDIGKFYSKPESSGNEIFGESFAPKIWNGKGGYCWGAASRLLDTDGNVIGAIESIRDVTERKHAEDTLAKLNFLLEKKVEESVTALREKDQILITQSRQAAMGEMLRNIAHQWRQPLNAIGIHVQNLLDKHNNGVLEKGEMETVVRKTMDQVQHLSHTIDDFRNFFKPEIARSEFDLVTAVEKSVGLVAETFKTSGIETIVDYTEPLVISGYPNRFSQVLLNLLNNALEAIREYKPGAPKVHFRIFREKNKNIVTVYNNAGEIPEKILTKIFEPYFTTKEMGTGIGLYMAKNIIEQHMGGRIIARNVNGGAEFRIEL